MPRCKCPPLHPPQYTTGNTHRSTHYSCLIHFHLLFCLQFLENIRCGCLVVLTCISPSSVPAQILVCLPMLFLKTNCSLDMPNKKELYYWMYFALYRFQTQYSIVTCSSFTISQWRMLNNVYTCSGKNPCLLYVSFLPGYLWSVPTAHIWSQHSRGVAHWGDS